jgi:diguanylate cyclase (GGDEF)-like protein/PAS domain S-box-containing protein
MIANRTCLRTLLLALGLLCALPAAALEKVTLQLKWKHQFQFAGYYAALEKGYFRDAGLDVQIKEADGTEDPIDTVLGKRADFGIGASELVLARSQGKPVVALAVILQHSPLVLLTAGNIDTVQAIADKRVMLVPHEVEMFAYFKREGLPIERIHQIPPSFNSADLLAGRVDAMSGYSTDEPFDLRAAHFRFNQLSPRSAGIDFYGDTLFTSDDTLRRKPAMVKAFRNASLAGWRYAMDHPGEIADLIRTRYSTRNSQAHLLFEAEEMSRLMQSDLVEIGHMNPGRWQHIADVYAELGLMPANAPLAGLIYDDNEKPLPSWFLPTLAGIVLALILVAAVALRLMRLTYRLDAEARERKAISERLAATQNDMAALIDATPGAAMLILPDGEILAMNGTGAARFGLDKKSIVGHNIFAMSHPPLADTRRLAVAQAIAERRTRVLEDERDGLSLRNTIVPVIDRDGEVRRVAVFSEDVTDLKRTETALRDSEAKYRFIAERSADVIWQIGTDMRFTYINEADEKMRGFPRSEVLGRPLAEVLTPASFDKVMQANAARMAAEQRGETTGTVQYELEQRCKNGGTVWTEINSSPMRDDAGKIVGFFGITRDITARKRAEDRLRAANERLQNQIAEIQRLQEALQEQAVRDSLTGLYNRRYLDETLEREISRAKREGHPLSLVMIDVDHFKRLNDTYGHQAGDQVLMALGDLLREDTRTEDVPCRYGGEEFLVLMPHMPLEAAHERAEYWRMKFAELAVTHGELAMRTTISLGVAAYPNHGHAADELTQCADLALYLAKHDGRNRVVVFEATPLSVDI